MRLEGVELVRVDVPFRREVGTAVGIHHTRSLLFVRVVADGISGWGECAALAEGTSVDPPVDAVEAVAIERGVRRLREAERGTGRPAALLGGDGPALRHEARRPTAGGDVRDGRGGPGAACLRRIAGALHRRDDRVRGHCGRWIRGYPARTRAGDPPAIGGPRRGERFDPPADEDRPRMGPRTGARRQGGPSRSGDPGRCQRFLPTRGRRAPRSPGRLRRALRGAAAASGRLDRFGRAGEADSASPSASTSPSRRSTACATRCATGRAPSPVSNRPGSGGCAAARAAHAACAAAGVPVFVGGFFEAGLGRASNLALAARLSMDAAGLVVRPRRPGGLPRGGPCGYPPLVDGWVRVPEEPGVGRPPDQGILDRLEARRRWFPATYT